MGNNGKEWDKIAILGIIVGAIVALATPEIRQCIGLEDKPVPQSEPKKTPPNPPVVHEEKEPAGPQEYTIGENKSEFIKEAKARLSVSFHDDTGEITAKITISPAGKDSIVLPTVGSGSQEFSLSAS